MLPASHSTKSNIGAEGRLLKQLNDVYEDLKVSSTPFSTRTQQLRNSLPSNVTGRGYHVHQYSGSLSAPSLPSLTVQQDSKKNTSLGKRKNSSSSDKPKKKRYTWTDDLHRKFMVRCYYGMGCI